MLRSLRALALVAPSFISSSFGWGAEDDEYLVDAQLVYEDLDLFYNKIALFYQESGWDNSIQDHCMSHDGFVPFFASCYKSKNFYEEILHPKIHPKEFFRGVFTLAQMTKDGAKKSDVELRKLQRSVFKNVDLQKFWSKTQVVVAEINFLISASDFLANFGLVADSNFEIPKKDLDVGKQWVGIVLWRALVFKNSPSCLSRFFIKDECGMECVVSL